MLENIKKGFGLYLGAVFAGALIEIIGDLAKNKSKEEKAEADS